MQFDSMLVDYLHPRKYPRLGPVATWTLRSATLGVLIGVYQFNTNDIGASLIYVHLAALMLPQTGLTELISKVWSA